MMASAQTGPTGLFVTFVDVEGQFCVVWGHTDKNAMSQVNQLIQGYAVHFNNGLGVVNNPNQLHKGLICVGKIDSNYYRLQVLSVHLNEVQVFLIDYGYPATVKLSDLHLATFPKESNILAVKPLCTKYVICHILMVAGKENEALNWIRPYLTSEETKMILHDPRINAVELHFHSNSKQYNVAQALSHKSFATTVSSRPEQFYMMYQKIMAVPAIPVAEPPQLQPHLLGRPPPSAMNPGPPVGWESGMSPGPTMGQPVYHMPGLMRPVQAPVPAMSSMIQGPKPTADTLLEGHIYQVVTTHVDEEDMTIVVHKKDEANSTLLNVITQINALPPIMYDKVLEPGAYVLARQEPGAPRLRAVVFRLKGMVPDKKEEQVEVYFVDFGHKAMVPVSEIYTIPAEFENLKSFAHRCHLANLELAGPWSKEVRSELQALVMDKILNMKVLPSPLKTKRTVALYTDDNQNVIDLLIQQLKPLMFESVHIPKGQSVEVVLSHALSASRFFVQLTSNQAALDTLMDQVQEHCDSVLAQGAPTCPFTDDQLISGNLACLAKFAEDGRWYRGIIMDYEAPGSVTVRYVDYGNESVVTKKDIIAIPRHLMKVRTQAVECSLAGHSSRRESEIEEAQFTALIEARDYTFLMTIKMQLVGSVLLVELWELNTKASVRQILQTMIAEAQKTQKVPTLVKSSPDSVTSESFNNRAEAPPLKNSFQRQSTRDKYSSDESESKGARPKLGADSTDWRKNRDEDSSGESRKPRFGDRTDSSRFNGDKSGGFGDKSGGFGDKNDRFGDKSGGFGDKGGGFGDKNDRFGDKGGGFGDKNDRFGDKSGGCGDRGNRGDQRFGDKPDRTFGDRGDSNRFGGGDDSRPPRKPRYGDENEKPNAGGKWSGNTGSEDKYSSDNTFRSAGRGPREERGGGGGFKKREDFAGDSWGTAKSFDSVATNYNEKPKKPQLLDGYPGGGRVPTLPALGALDDPRLVSVTHYESPLSFFVQLQDSHESFLEFMKGLQTDYIKRKPIERSELQVGQHVMAQFTQDRCLYRAEVLQTSPEIKVKFFDYGNQSSVPGNRVYNLASEHCALPQQSIPCKLSNVVMGEATNPMDCVQYFSDDQYQMIIKGYDESSKAEVDLITKASGVQVATRLVEAGLASLVPMDITAVSVEDPIYLPLLLNQTLSIHLSYIESTRKFFVQLEPDKPDFIAAKIVEVLTKPEELFPLTAEEIAVGKFVLATPDSELWYRARVLSKPEGEVSHYTVKFIDYGDEGEVTLENIRDLPESLCNWSPQAFECYLTSASEDLLDEALETEFAETWSDINATVIVSKVADKRLSVLLYLETGELQAKFHPALPDNIEAPSAVSPLCPYPVLRQGDKVFISHGSVDALFLQKVSNEDSQAEFATDIMNYYSTTELPVLEVPKVGDIVAGKSITFDSWYRSRVDGIESDGQISVYYVDYGNSETIPVANLRALDATHFFPPAYCLKATMPGTFVKDSYEMFVDVPDTFDAVYARGEDGQDWLVNLIDAHGSLIEKHSLAGQLEVAPSHPFMEKESVLDRWLPLGSVPVTVMSFESPSELSISLEEDETVQDELQARLQEFAHGTMPILGECQELCLGKFSDDDQWYRARVLDAEFRALFVDYGNKDIVPEIRKLDYALRTLPPLSVKCALPLVPTQGTEWPQEALDRLDALVTDQATSGRIVDYDVVPFIEVLVDGKSVADVLIEEKLALRKPYKVVITHVLSVEELYVQYVDNVALDEVYAVMETIATNAPLKAAQVEEGDIVAAKYPLDEAWYRARIVKKEPAEPASSEEGESSQPAFTVEVVFVDFGNGAVTTEFRRLPARVAKLPPLAKPCALALPDGETWPETAKDKLEEIAQEGAVKFDLKWLDSGKIVEVIDAKGMNVVDTILEPPPLKNYVLSHINSTTDFYLQEENDPNINTIADLLSAYDAEPEQDSVPLEELIAAKFVDDGAWYRARVVSTDPALEVLFVDYGNTSEASEFKALSEALRAFQPCAIHCSLANDAEPCAGLSPAANEKFVELSAGCETVYTADFLPEVDGRKPACLYIGEDCVADLLAEVADVETPAVVGNEVESSRDAQGTEESGLVDNKVLISWVNSVDDFYVQKVGDPSLDTIADALETISEGAPIEVHAGDVVAAQFVDDEQWYRSRVEGEDGAGSHLVHFVDYGNSSTASEFRQLPPTLTLEAIPACARKCTLGKLSVANPSANDVLNELADKDVEMEMLQEEDGVCTVELMCEGECLSEVISRRVSIENEKPSSDEPESSQEPISPQKSQSPSEEPFESKPVSSDVASPVKSSVSPSKESSPSRQSLKEKARSAEAQKVHLITHVNSPSDFYLMIDAEASITIGTLLNNAADFEPVHSVIMGGTYAAFNEREDSWHRAKLIELIENDGGSDSFLVKYIDFGNTDIVTKDSLRELPDDLREIPNVVQKSELATPEEFVDWSEAAERKLSDLVVSGKFYIERPRAEHPARVVLRTTDGLNVNEMLLKIQAETDGHDSTLSEDKGEDGNETLNDTIISEAPSKNLAGQQVVVSYYISAEDFYVQVVKDGNILDSVNSLLETLKDVPASEVVEGQVYAGKTSGGEWYRVSVVWEKSEQEETLVRRIDYGDRVTCGEFKALSEDLGHISPLAHHCQLKDGGDLARWKEEKTELVVVEIEESQPLTVTLKEIDGKDETTEESVELTEEAVTNGVSNGTADSPKKESTPVKTVADTSSPVTSPTQSLLDKTNGFDISMD